VTRITRITATPVRIARSILLTTSYGATRDSSTVVVEVDTDEGLVGLGQTTSAAPWYGDSVAAIMRHLDGSLAPAMIGCDALNIEDAVRRMDQVLPGALFAKTALELALWDLAGKALGVPVYRLLGGRVHEGICLHGFVHHGTPAQMADRARQQLEDGWTVLKMKIGMDPAEDLTRYRVVREAVEDRARFQLDGNTGYTMAQAVPTLQEMERLGGVAVFEQPVKTNAEMAHLRTILESPLMADEALHAPTDALEIARLECAHVLHMKLHKFGGLAKARRIAAVAEAAGMQVSVAPYTDIELAAAAHFAAAVPNATWPAGFTPMEDSVLLEPYTMSGQRVLPREAPGLGVELDRPRLARLATAAR
jgi:muconate cycloisomerase